MLIVFWLNAKKRHIVVPPQADRRHCILVSALSLSNAVAYSECNVKLIYAERQNAVHRGTTTDTPVALHFSMSRQFVLSFQLNFFIINPENSA
jgi:hypothetical protein